MLKEAITMDFGKLIEETYNYTKTGVFNRTDRWLRLILATILIGIPLYGWVLRIYRGANPAPDVDAWGTLCIDGLKLLIICLIYAIPVILITLIQNLVLYGSIIGVGVRHVGTAMPFSPGKMLLFLALIVIFEIIIAILVPIASIRFARTGKFLEAFNFRAIIDSIGKIGWLNYIIAIILLAVVIGIPIFVLVVIAVFAGIFAGHILIALGIVLLFILIITPLLATFQARYYTQVYDSAVQTA